MYTFTPFNYISIVRGQDGAIIITVHRCFNAFWINISSASFSSIYSFIEVQPLPKAGKAYQIKKYKEIGGKNDFYKSSNRHIKN
ncbi:hypothetical protein CW304_14765 [Bacillus sp. UFRGS-B20]|nr:hypothetical protein CW304_14765 [Bacillus sp. UFRGS-B20]